MIGTRRTRRVWGVVAAALLATAIASPAGAADTRNVYVGDPGGDGTLHLTPVSTDNSSAFAVLVANRAGQTETTPTLTITGADVAGFYGPDATYCDAEAGRCTFPNLAGAGKAGDSRQVIVEVTAPSLPGTLGVTATLTINEGRNPNGSNNQIFAATGSVAVSQSTDDATADYLPPGKDALLNTKPGANNHTVGVAIPDTSGHAIAIVEGDDPGTDFCAAAGVRCFGDATRLTIDGGANIEPYANVTFFWAAGALPKGFNPKFAGVAHLLDDGTVVTIPNNPKTAACAGDADVDCLVGSSYDKKVGFSMTVRFPVNGFGKGYA